MFSKNERKGLKAWVRYDGNNNAVAGSLIFQKDKPKVGKWKEYKDVNLCCSNYSPWTIVTGGIAGDGTVSVDDPRGLGCPAFTFVGPNDMNSSGWVYLTQYFGIETCLDIFYEWTSFDDAGGGPPQYDKPVYWTSSTQPTGIPADTTSKVNSTPKNGEWNVTIPAGQWFAIGIYSGDSCCGRGFLQVQICSVECSTP